MQFTPQQMAGYKGYSTGVLIGNWSEDLQVQEDKMRKYQHLAHQQQLGGTVTGAAAATITAVAASKRVSLTPKHPDGFLRFGDVIMLQSSCSGGYLALDVAPRSRPKLNHALVTTTTSAVPTARSTWVIRRAVDANNKFYEAQNEGDVVHYGQFVRIVNEYCSGDGDYSLCSCPLSASAQSRISGRQEVTACLGGATDCFFSFEQSDGKQASAPLDGNPVPVDATLVVRHKGTHAPLYADKQTLLMSSVGGEHEVSAHLAKAQATRVNVPVLQQNFWTIKVAPAGAAFTPFGGAGGATEKSALQRIREKILSRGGSIGFRGLVKSLRIMDDDGSRTLSRRELKEGMEIYGIPLTTHELDIIFKEFDRNGDCTISITEFLRTIRGDMNLRRTDIVRLAFRKLDRDGTGGGVTMEELREIYGANAANHPLVKAGKKTVNELMREFAACWDKDADGKITMREFEEYYSDISAGIDDDDYFELMVAAAWNLGE